MEQSNLTSYVIERLVGGEDPDDIIYELCEMCNWSWPRSEAFVLQVQQEHQGEVVKKQFPLLFTVAVTTYVTGIGLMVYSLYSLIKKVEIHRVMGFPAPDVLNGIRLLLDFGIGPAILFVTGLAMVLGSLIGMQDVWKSLLARDPEESE